MSRRIVFFAPPYSGHLNPMIPLGEAARSAGYDVSFMSGESKRQTLEAAGFTFEGLPSLDDKVLKAISDTPDRLNGRPLRILRQLKLGLNFAIGVRLELTERWRSNPPDLVVADSVAFIAGLSADDLGVPWVSTVATPFAIDCHRGPPPYIGIWGEGDSLGYRLRDAAGRLFVRGVKHGLQAMLRKELKQLGASFWRDDGSEAIYSRLAILGFGLTELEFERDWPKHFRMIGPVYSNPERNTAVTLPESTPRVLVTLGTHLPWAKATLESDLAWLAAQRPAITFVGSLGAPLRAGEAPRVLGANAILHPFVPYESQLESFDAVIHHGGAGVTYAAIAAGKPAVVVPHDYDQFDFAARIVAKGAGLKVERLRSPATLAAVDSILDGRSFPLLPALSAASHRYRPGEAFLETVSQILG